MKRVILGIGITNSKSNDVLKYIIAFPKNEKGKLVIVTPNPEILILARKDLAFRHLLNQAQIALPDGVGLIWAAWILGRPLQERIPGTDFLELLCKESIKEPISIGFFGGRKGVAKQASECLMEKYPGLQIRYAVEESEIEKLHKIPVDILFVGLGAPRQEMFIHENISKLPVRIAMGVGGAFDYFSGSIPRAPRLLRVVGLEWLFRLIRQPWRAKRQLALIKFICLVLLLRLGMIKD